MAGGRADRHRVRHDDGPPAVPARRDRDDVPLTTALVELDEAPGVRLVAHFERGDEPRIGDRVRGRFESTDGRPDLRFETC